MERLAADPQLRARYATAARKRVVNEYAASLIGHQIVALYERLLSKVNSSR
jgi:glycosyltransferase involved in cell wall biosynthesis